MLHVYGAVLTLLLCTCGALTGSLPSLLAVVYMLLLRSPRSPVHTGVIYGVIASHLGVVLASLLVNLVSSTSSNASQSLYGVNVTSDALKGIGIYQMNTGSAWKYVASVVPEIATGVFALLCRRQLKRIAPARRIMSIQWAMCFWGSVAAAVALVEPSILGGMFVVLSLYILCCVAFAATMVASSGAVRVLSLVATMSGCLVLCVWGAAQNYAAWPFFNDHVDPVIGLKVFCNFQSWKDARCAVQFALCLVASVFAHVMTQVAERLDLEQQHGRRGASPQASQRLVTRSGSGATSPPLTQKLLRAQQSQSPSREGSAAKPAIMLSAARLSAPPPSALGGDGASHSHGSESLFAKADVVEALMRAFRFVATWIMNNFIILPLFPMMCVAAIVVVFPAIPSISLFPLLFVGLLKPNAVRTYLLPMATVFGLLFACQYFIFAVSEHVSNTLVALFLCETQTGWQLAEVACNLCVFVVLLATYIQQARFGNAQERRARQAAAAQNLLLEDAQIVAQREAASRHRLSSTNFSAREAPEETTRSTLVEDDVDDEAEFIKRSAVLLGEDRVERIRRMMTTRIGAPRISSCFYRLTGRMPTDEELRTLRSQSPLHRTHQATSNGHLDHYQDQQEPSAHEDPLIQVLRRRRILAALPLWRQLMHDVSILLNHYSMNFTILFTFVAGSCVNHMDVIHAVVLALFLVYFLMSDVARRYWIILVVYMAGLTVFEVVFTFVDKFSSVESHVAPGVKARTVGLVPLPTRWSAISYFVVLFFVCGQYHLLKAMTMSWDELFALFEWRRFLQVPAVRLIRQRGTMAIAATVFVALGLFETRSLLVEGFLLFFLVICICTAYGASSVVLKRLWGVASTYAGLVMLAVSLYQFQDIAEQVDRLVDSVDGCAPTDAVARSMSCQKEIGVVAPEGYVLTYFLAPWFIALVTAVAHMACVDDDDLSGGGAPLGKSSGAAAGGVVVAASAPASDDNPHHSSSSLLRMNSSKTNLAASRPTASGAAPSETTSLFSHQTRRAPSGDEMTTVRHQRQLISSGDYAAHDEDDEAFLTSPLPSPRHHRTSAGNHRQHDATGMQAAKRRYCAPDQVLFHFMFLSVHFAEASGDVAVWVGREYGAVLVWASLYVAATAEYTLMACAYALFLVLDLSSITSLVYCVCHLTALYSYQFSFTPKINATWNHVDWAEFIGFIKSDAPEANAIGPVLVFFAVLFRAKTAPRGHAIGEHDAASAVMSTSGVSPTPSGLDTRATGGGLVAHHLRAKSWLSYLHHQAFYLIGYEVFILSVVLNVQVSITVAAGVLTSAILVLTICCGRTMFFSSKPVSYALQVMTTVLFLFQIAAQLNDNHQVWTVPSTSGTDVTSEDRWVHYFATGTATSMFYAFVSLVLLHALHSKWQRIALIGADEPIEVWVQRWVYHGATDLRAYLHEAYQDTERMARLVDMGLNAHQPLAKRMRNVLKHCNDERLEELMPSIPDSLARWDGNSSGGVRRVVADGGAEGTAVVVPTSELPPKPSMHFLYHNRVMHMAVRVVAATSPVAFLSFAAGTVNPSIVCTLFMVAGLLQFSFQDILHWKFYRLWLPVERVYFAFLVGLPLIVNVPPIAEWVVGHETATSIIGLSESGLPVGVNATRAALLFMIALQSRIYQDFWFERVIRGMRSALHKRARKHQELLESLAAQQAAELKIANNRNQELRAKLQLVRATYGLDSILVGPTAVSPMSFTSTAHSPKVVDESKIVLPGTLEATLRSVGAAENAAGDGAIGNDSLPGGHAASQLSPFLPRLSFRGQAASSSITGLQDRSSLFAHEPALNEREDSTTVVATQADNVVDPAADGIDAGIASRCAVGAAPIIDNDADANGRDGMSDDSSDAATPPPTKPSVSERAQEFALAVAEQLLPYTFYPEALRERLLCNTQVHPLLCPLYAALRVAERHTAQIVALLTVANFIQSGTAWDALPAFAILTVVTVYDPFAPLKCYEVLSQVIVVGIVAKAIVLVLVSHLDFSDGLVDFINWSLVTADGTTRLSSRAQQQSGVELSSSITAYGDLILDFFAFAAIVVHKHVSFSCGVYSEVDRRHSAGQGDGNRNGDTDDDDDEAQGVIEVKPEGSDNEDVVATRPVGVEQADGEATAAMYLPIPDAPSSDGDQRGAGGSDAGRGAPSPPAPTAPLPTNAVAMLLEFVANATSTHGVGADLYLLSALADFATLLILVFNYYAISGGGNGSIVQNVQDNVLPGPFVVAVLGSLVAMLIDRMLYASSYLLGKLIFNTVYAVVLFVLYSVWLNVVEPPLLGAGVTLFCFKCLYLYVSCFQLRRGYPLHRRHDPFTHRPDDLLPWIGYQIFRAIPFLWEMRVVADWTVSRTALRLPCYLKVENLYDTVYNRYVSIGEAKAQQPKIGTPVKMAAKISDGVVRVVIILFAVLFPLMYYSSFNPTMGSNQIGQIQLDVSFESSSPFFSSSLFNVLSYPGDLALWIARTRPILGSYGITSKHKEVQLIDLSSCSSSLWSISPQGQRLLIQQLNNTYYNATPMHLNLQLGITRGAAGSDGSDSTTQSVQQTIRHPWTLPWNTAGAILQALDNASDAARNASSSVSVVNDSVIIPLNGFYSPFIFNQPTQVQYFPMMSGSPTLDTVECSIVLRSEYDALILSRVHYWCLKCNSIFSSGNYPNSSLQYFPEWPCLTQDANCPSFNFEAKATNYTPVPIYFVFFSDPIPQTLAFLPNIGIIAIYTTFVLALGRVLRGMFTTTAVNIVQTDMVDPTPVARLIEYITIARTYGQLSLEQSVYYELIDLLRSPERLLRLSGLHKKAYDGDDADGVGTGGGGGAAE